MLRRLLRINLVAANAAFAVVDRACLAADPVVAAACSNAATSARCVLADAAAAAIFEEASRVPCFSIWPTNAASCETSWATFVTSWAQAPLTSTTVLALLEASEVARPIGDGLRGLELASFADMSWLIMTGLVSASCSVQEHRRGFRQLDFVSSSVAS